MLWRIASRAAQQMLAYEYTLVWAKNNSFNEIVVSPTMATDHFPNRVCLEIENMALSFGLDTGLDSSDYAENTQKNHKLHPIPTPHLPLF